MVKLWVHFGGRVLQENVVHTSCMKCAESLLMDFVDTELIEFVGVHG
jgi:hypothetical protein